MIPKIIHYCWFGNSDVPMAVSKNVLEWSKLNPHFKIIQWDERNFSIDKACSFVKDAYKNKDWAFVTDYVRLYAVFKYGGVYLDTDVKLLQPLQKVLNDYPAGYMGFESRNKVASGLGFAAQKGDLIIKEMLEYYHELEFNDNKLSDLACPVINTKILKRHGLKGNNTKQKIGNLVILPTEYLCPINIFSGEKLFTKNTISVHEYNASWMGKYERNRMYIIAGIKRYLPNRLVVKLRAAISKLGNK